MNHRLIAFVLILATFGFVRPQFGQDSSQRPNVLFIAVDDLRPQLGCYGHKQMVTPHMDRLASRGVSFTNAHTNDPLCAPSRSSMLFGLYPQTTGLYWFEDWRDNPILCPLLATF